MKSTGLLVQILSLIHICTLIVHLEAHGNNHLQIIMRQFPIDPVSYTHLDVYKRQEFTSIFTSELVLNRLRVLVSIIIQTIFYRLKIPTGRCV